MALYQGENLIASTGNKSVLYTEQTLTDEQKAQVRENIGALSNDTAIPSKTSDLTNDSGFLTDYTETDPTVPDWAKASTKPSYTASEVGAAPASHAEDSNIHVTVDEKAAWNECIQITNSTVTLPASIRWKSITYGNGKFVAVAESSDIVAYSTDGITWTQTTLPTSIRWWSVTYGDGKFVAVAYSSSIAAYSTDGITWTQTTLPTSAYLSSVTYGNGKFVAVAESSDIAAYSADGITWTQTTLPTSANWRSVTYGSGKFVAVTYNNSIAAYSTDGITWTQSALPIYTFWYSVTYGSGKFVAVAANSNTTAYSTDGITWTQSTLPASANWQSVTYGSDKFVAIAYNSKIVAYSTDGITWTRTLLPTIAYWQSVTYGSNKFVVVAESNNIAAYSTDGINWVNSISQLQNTSGEDITSDVKEILGVDQPVSVDEKTIWNEKASKPTITSVTLTASGWDSTSLTQTVTVTGILADETKQLIQAMPTPASMSAITSAGVYCSAQGENSLTFTCTAVPSEDIVFNVSFQDAEYM